MALRYYRNGPQRALAFPLANGTDTAITVDSASGFPIQFPYTIILDPDLSTEEVCDVTAAVGNVLTITRGVDSTTAVAHGAGALVYHGVSARDPREANEHVNAVTNVHGRTGALVDTDSVQNIPGRKIFDDAESTGGGNFVDVGASQTVTGAKTFSALTTMANQTVTGTEVHSGTETHTGVVGFSNTENHTGVENHAGTVQHSHAAMLTRSAFSTVDEVTTSATFAAGGTPVGAAFTAPPSGKILVHMACWLQQDITDQTVIASFGIYAGSTPGAGAEIVAPSGDRAVSIGGVVTAGVPIRGQFGRTSYITGLTPGTAYVATVMFQTTTPATAHVFNREIIVQPLMG